MAVAVIAVAGVVGIVAAVAQWWSLLGVATVVLLMAVGGLLILALRDLGGTRRSIARVERRVEASAARGLAIDEHVRAEIVDRLEDLAEATRAIAPRPSAPDSGPRPMADQE